MDHEQIFDYAGGIGQEYVVVYNNTSSGGGDQIEEHIDPGTITMCSEGGMEDEMKVFDEQQLKSKIVHQCDICNKTFVSFKGLQQHSVVHTGQKPFACDICNKSFRFKSNLFEHRSVHSGTSPHACPYCGKTCRLKGNLKKHLKTHVTTKEELDVAWLPFSSNRRPPAEVPQDAIFVRSNGEQALFTPPGRQRKRKTGGLGADSKFWVDKIRSGELMRPSISIDESAARFKELIISAQEGTIKADDFFVKARSIPFERHTCPVCKLIFITRGECMEHIAFDHPNTLKHRSVFCETCMRTFSDKKSMQQHEISHQLVRSLIDLSEVSINEPEISLLPSKKVKSEDVVTN